MKHIIISFLLITSVLLSSVYGNRQNNSPALAIEEPELFTDSYVRQTISDLARSRATAEIIKAFSSDSESYRRLVKERILKEVNSMIDAGFTGDTDGLAEAVTTEDISSEEWRRLEEEFAAELLMGTADLYIEEAVSRISKEVFEKYSPSEDFSDAAFVKAVESFAGSVSENFFQNHKPCAVSADEADLPERSRTWLEIKERLKRDFRLYAYMLSTGNERKKMPVVKVRSYKKNPQAFDMLIFPEQQPSKAGFSVTPHREEQGEIFLAVPSMPDINRIRLRIDKTRRAALRRLPDNRDAGYLKAIDGEFAKAIREETAPAARVFAYERAGLVTRAIAVSAAANGQAFAEAEAELEKIRSAAGDYRKVSMDFLENMNEGFNPKGEDLADIFKAGLARGKARASFIEELSAVPDCRRRAVSLFGRLDWLGALPVSFIAHMNEDEVRGALKEASRYRADIRQIRASAAAGGKSSEKQRPSAV